MNMPKAASDPSSQQPLPTSAMNALGSSTMYTSSIAASANGSAPDPLTVPGHAVVGNQSNTNAISQLQPPPLGLVRSSSPSAHGPVGMYASWACNPFLNNQYNDNYWDDSCLVLLSSLRQCGCIRVGHLVRALSLEATVMPSLVGTGTCWNKQSDTTTSDDGQWIPTLDPSTKDCLSHWIFCRGWTVSSPLTLFPCVKNHLQTTISGWD